MSTLAAFLPIDRLHALAAGESLPDRSEGAVLFADIRGFTSLAEALTSALGPRRGAEELTEQLNRVTCVDILRAAGDARADDVLARGLELLIAHAARITDEAVRRSFLENVPAHRALGQAARPTLLT